MNILRTAKLGSNFTGSYKKKIVGKQTCSKSEYDTNYTVSVIVKLHSYLKQFCLTLIVEVVQSPKLIHTEHVTNGVI